MRLWTWRGAWFGYREGWVLWASDGRQVGQFVDGLVYGPSGRYLGEVRAGRLVTHRASAGRRGPSFTAPAPRVATRRHVDLVAFPLPPGDDDFPAVAALP